MSASAKVLYAIRTAATGIWRAPFVHGVAVGTLAIVLFAAGLGRAGARWLDALVGGMGGAVELTVYLRDGARQSDAEALSQVLSQRTGGAARPVDPAEALTRLSTELGPLGSVVAELPDNPLPLSVELEIPDAQRAPDSLRALAQELKALPAVEAVDYGEAAVERVSATVRALKWGGLFAFAVVAVAAAVIVAATLQLAVYARRQEIEIQKLVGATDRFVQTPFLIQGLLQGLFGAGVACAGLWALTQWVGPVAAHALAFLAPSGASEAWASPRLFGELFASGGVLGLAGSFLAVARLSRV